jgi:nitrate reductase delta subunit
VSAVLYDRLAALLRYPDAAYLGAVDTCCQALAATEPGVGAYVERFAAGVRGMRVADLEELFTHTFDINPLCSLEVGWQLFGEQYERGTFLVRMRQEMRRLELPESTELPDHLTHVLAVLGRMDPERADDFATACVLPAVKRMCTALSGKENPYGHALGAIRTFLVARHGAALAEEDARASESGDRTSIARMECP